MSFTWIPYYKEFAQRLTQFQKDRKRLLNLIYDNRDELLAKYLHDQGGEGDLLEDIDPFTVFGLFNRGIKHENRINSAKLFKNILDIKVDIPKDFEGIPVLNNQKSHFFGFRSHRGKNDIQNLWNLFIKVVNDENFEEEYNTDKIITPATIRIAKAIRIAVVIFFFLLILHHLRFFRFPLLMHSVLHFHVFPFLP